jgi:hypothetical protein
MTVKVSELIAELKKMPQDAEVFIGLETFDGVALERGRIAKELTWFGNKKFVRVEDAKKRDAAVMFTRRCEFADGSVDQNWI